VLIPVKCGLNDTGRKIMVASSIGVAAATLLAPWLEVVTVGSAILSAMAFQTYACSKERKAKVEREVSIYEGMVHVKVKGPKGAKLLDVVTATPLRGSLEGVEVVEYQISLDAFPFVYWNGVIIEVERGPCKCWGYGALRELVSSWNVEGLGLGKVIEEEGGYQAVPEVEGTREYRPGDEPRLIIWKTLFSPGGLRVKELKRVKEVVVLDKGIKTFNADPGPWSSNSCFREMFNSVYKYLKSIGLRESQPPVDVYLLGPSARVVESSLYLLLNPLACIPPLVHIFPALKLVINKIHDEVIQNERALKDRGTVKVIPWSLPPAFL